MESYVEYLHSFKEKPFSMQDAREEGIPRSYVRKWLDNGLIERISHGIYKVASDEYENITSYIDASYIIGGPSAVCLLSALEFYNITDQIPRQTWMMVPVDKRSHNPKVRLLRSRNPMWQIGIKKHKGFRITSIERTLIDCLLHKKVLGSSVVMESIREALRTEQTDFAKIIKMAKKMNVYNRIETTIEALI